jgi:recombination protein RecT
MTQTTAIQLREYSTEELQVIQQTIAKGTTPQQFQLFMKTAQYAGLNPFLNHIYCIVYGQGQNATMSIQISVEGIVYLAKQHPDYRGYDVQLVHENDEFKARKIKHENDHDSWEIVTHEVGFPRGKVIGCYAIAYREGFRPFVVLMDIEEVQHNLTGRNAGTWKTYFNDMFKKHVLKRAIKGQFGIEIAEDEVPISGADHIPAYQSPERKDITAEANAVAEAEQAQKDQQAAKDGEAAKMEELRKQMNAKFKQLGISGKEAKAAYIAEKGVVKGDTPTMQELIALIKIMDMDIAKRAEQTAAHDDDDLLLGGEIE